jgi:hypothetical protein
MSNLITPVDLQILEAVTGGTPSTPSTPSTPRCSSTSNDALLQTLTSLSSTIQNLGNNSNSGGLTMTEVMMFGLLMNQNRQVNVFVRRPYW